MKRYSSLLFLAAALMLTSPAMAEVRGGAFTVFPFVGGYTFDGVQHLQTNVATGVAIGYNITGHWGVEGRFTWVPLQTTRGDVPGEYSLFNFHGDMLYHFMPENRLVPYVALGGGWSRTEWPNGDNDDAILVYGGGVKYSLNDWLALRGDIRQIFSFHTDRYGPTAYWNNFEYTFGLSFQFGGSEPGTPPAAAPQPEAPAPEPVPHAPAPAPVPASQATVTPPVTQAPVIPPATQTPVTAPETQAPGVTAPAPELPETVRTPKAPVPAPALEAAPSLKPAQPAPTAEGQTSWQAKEGSPLPAGKIALTGISVRPDALEMTFTKGFFYEIYALSKPRRLEIDIRGALNGLDVDSLTINRIGIATVRLENQADFLRVVLYPAAGYQLPSRIDVINNFRGLLIHMAPPLENK